MPLGLGQSRMNFTEFCEREDALYKKYTSPSQGIHYNFLKISVSNVPVTDAGMEEFNDVVRELDELGFENHLKRTKSGGLSTQWREPDFVHYGYDVVARRNYIELTVKGTKEFRLRMSSQQIKDGKEIHTLGGRKCFLKFKEICEQFGVNLEDYKISKEEGEKTKKEIPSAIIDVDETVLKQTRYNVHHIDIHSAHMSGVGEAFEPLLAPVNYCYEQRKEAKKNGDEKKNTLYKSILTNFWGYCQSEYIDYRYANLSKAGIESTNRKVNDLTERLKNAGRRVLMHNTDGIWYEGEIFHGEGEGEALGEWSNDHTNCMWRAKSKGVYEYIENEKYTVVARGSFELDRAKDRKDWKWGDIFFTGKIVSYKWNPETRRIEKE